MTDVADELETGATGEEVGILYRALLGRPPESVAAVEGYADRSLTKAALDILGSEEFQRGRPGRPGAERTSPFYVYAASFDAEAIMRRHAVVGLSPDPARLINFLGVRIDPAVLPSVLAGREGEVEAVPIPANWHADIAEWAAALRAVELAEGRFTVVELGCGWGCWMNNTGAAARALGLPVRLVGVEGDEGHAEMARRSCADNGFTPEVVTIHRGVAAAQAGVALFPKGGAEGEHYGFQPIFGANKAQVKKALASGRYDCLPMIPLADILAVQGRVDLLHVDIQGGEADLVHGSRKALNAHVGYLLIGTHSRALEGQLCEDLLAWGWRLEVERAGLVHLHTGAPVMHVDGVQGWRNMRLLPD